MSGLLLVTAPNADYKFINRLLLHLRDWEYGDAPTWDSFHLVTTRDVNGFKASGESNTEPTVPPISPDFLNEWRNSSIQEVEAFMLEIDKAGTEGSEFNIYILVDEKSMQDKTCIVGERRFDDETEQRVDAFNKIRVPWDQVHSVWANLDISNMDFLDFCVDEEVGEDGWGVYDDSEDGPGLTLDEEKRLLREEAIKALEDEGKA